jgi:glycosyltransferase involved in cell wall biosynthesis
MGRNVSEAKPLSICFFSHSAELCGAERSLLELVAELVADYGVSCSVVVPRTGPLVAALESAGAACILSPYSWWCDKPPLPKLRGARRLQSSIAVLQRETLPALENIDPDVIVTQTLVIPWGAMAAAILGKPHVWSVCEYGEQDHGLEFFAPFEQVLQDIINSSTIIYTASNALGRALFPTLGPEKCRTLYRHVSIPDISGMKQPSGCYVCAGATRLAVFGNLQESKGQEDAVLAVAQLVGNDRNVELLLAGQTRDPGYYSRIQSLVKEHQLVERVQIPGFLPDPYPAMHEADIIISCSRREAFGRVVVEAMLMRKPVIYPTVAGVAECMIDGETGYAYQPGDVSGLVARISALMDNPARVRALVDAAHSHAAERFSREAYGGEVYRTSRSLRDQQLAAAMPSAIQSWLGPNRC